jgi:hypothetical protein
MRPALINHDGDIDRLHQTNDVILVDAELPPGERNRSKTDVAPG